MELLAQSKLSKQQLEENRMKSPRSHNSVTSCAFFFPERITENRKCYRALSTRHLKLVGKRGRNELQSKTEHITQSKVQVLGYDLEMKE